MSTEDDISGKQTGTESALSTYAGPYVTEMLGRGRAIAETPYEAYMGPLTAGTSALQDTAFTGLAGLALPTDASGASAMGAFTPGTFAASGAPTMATEGADAPAATGVVGEYMNPYLSAVLNPQLQEARRQAEISRQAEAGRFTRAGAFGGSRQALADLERDDRLNRNLADITGKGYAQAFESARRQFNVEQDRAKQAQDMANRFGFDVLGAQTRAGQIQRDIEAEGIAADKAQFEEERDFPYRQVSYMQSLLSGLPLATQSYSYAQPSALSNILAGGGLPDILASIFGINKKDERLPNEVGSGSDD
tara:strand:+ start:872 stop:1792 length:921 start_codon:yes stop_codon:yes gene_type:complete